MKAKNAPAKKATTETPQIHQLTFLKIEQTRACFGSMGHGILRARHIISPAAVIITAAIPNTQILYRDSQIMAGKELVNPANVAPIPSDTNNAGRAQQTNVPADVNRLNPEGKSCLKAKLSAIIIQKLLMFRL